MTKDQRARHATLSALTTEELTPAQAEELTTLQALAAQHPDPAQDTDGATAPEAAAPAAAEKAEAKPARTLGEILRSALHGAKDPASTAATLTETQAQLATAQQTLETAQTDLATATARVAELTAQQAAVAALFGVEATALAGLDAPATTALFERAIATAAREQIAALGVAAADLPAPTPKASESEIPADLTGLARAQAALALQAQRHADHGIN